MRATGAGLAGAPRAAPTTSPSSPPQRRARRSSPAEPMEDTAMAAAEGFDLATTYVHLDDGPAARPVPVDDDFWQTIEQRRDLHGGRLVIVSHNAAHWPAWEMHRQARRSCISSPGRSISCSRSPAATA